MEKKTYYTETQKRASMKYARTHYKRIPLDLQKQDYDYLKGFCDSRGIAVNAFIKDAIKAKIDSEKNHG